MFNNLTIYSNSLVRICLYLYKNDRQTIINTYKHFFMYELNKFIHNSIYIFMYLPIHNLIQITLSYTP